MVTENYTKVFIRVVRRLFSEGRCDVTMVLRESYFRKTNQKKGPGVVSKCQEFVNVPRVRESEWLSVMSSKNKN